MKLDRVTLPRPVHVGALNATREGIDAKRDQVALDLDPRALLISVHNEQTGRISLILPGGAVADVSEEQDDDRAGAAEGAPGPAARRGRKAKDATPVSG